MFVALLLPNLAYTFAYDIPDKSGYFLPGYLAWTVLIAFGARRLADRLHVGAQHAAPLLTHRPKEPSIAVTICFPISSN
jgi:hypothetical protein